MQKHNIAIFGFAVIGIMLIIVGTANVATYYMTEKPASQDLVTIDYYAYHQSEANLTFANYHCSFLVFGCSYAWTPLGYNGTYYHYQTTSHNLLVNVMGVTWAENKWFTASYENTSTIANYVGISTSAAAPAYTDTALASEQTGTGLARTTCTSLTLNSASAGAITATCVVTFTNNTGGAVTGLQKAGWFINSVSHCAVTSPSGNGCLFATNTFASTNLNPLDAVQLTWTCKLQG